MIEIVEKKIQKELCFKHSCLKHRNWEISPGVGSQNYSQKNKLSPFYYPGMAQG